MQGSVHDFDQTTGTGSLLLDDGRRVGFDAAVFAASGLRLLRPGQRLTLELDDDTAAGPRARRLRLNGI